MRELQERIQELWAGHHVPAHNANHAFRVAGLARRIALAEGIDPDEAEAAGLVHDVGRLESVEEARHAEAGVPRAKALLEGHMSFSVDARERILSAVRHHTTPDAPERLTQILQDADMIDALGAVGLMRAYVSKSRLPEYPEGVIVEQWSRDIRTIGDQIALQMQMYNWLHTATAKEIGLPRLDFMRSFLMQLKSEVEVSLG